MLITEIKTWQRRIEKKEKKYMTNYYYKRNNVLHYLINCVEEIEIVCISR